MGLTICFGLFFGVWTIEFLLSYIGLYITFCENLSHQTTWPVECRVYVQCRRRSKRTTTRELKNMLKTLAAQKVGQTNTTIYGMICIYRSIMANLSYIKTLKLWWSNFK